MSVFVDGPTHPPLCYTPAKHGEKEAPAYFRRRVVEATVRAVVSARDGVRLQVDYGHDLHNALQKASHDLSDGRFAISRIEPVRDENGNVVVYQVRIRH